MTTFSTPRALRLAACLSVSLSLSLALVACGGGGADGGTLAAAPTPAPAPPAAALPADPVADPVAGTRATCNLADFQAEALRLVNAARAAGGSCGSSGSSGSFAPSAPLAWNTALAQAALVHSDDMVAGDFFSHTGSDGSSAGARASAAGYSAGTWGENIAAGQRTVAAVMQSWMASPGHCANILRASYRDIGLACVAGTGDSRYGTYWTMVLGAQR